MENRKFYEEDVHMNLMPGGGGDDPTQGGGGSGGSGGQGGQGGDGGDD